MLFNRLVFPSLLLLTSLVCHAQDDYSKISIKADRAGGNVYMLSCVDGFGGGNVSASVGEDGVLIADDMYAVMAPKLREAIGKLSDQPIRIVLNSHFHGDHIQGNSVFKKSAVIIAHENVGAQIMKNAKDPVLAKEMVPTVGFKDRLTINFNGEEIQLIHYPNSHTDGDVMIYFTKSKVIHLGDMFFFGMFPAVYTQGGGDIRQLIVSLDKILKEVPNDVKVVPGHGELATYQNLSDYVTMLKETTQIVDAGIKKGKTLDQLKADKVLVKYDALGEGGAQTTEQYLTMLYKLLSPSK